MESTQFVLLSGAALAVFRRGFPFAFGDLQFVDSLKRRDATNSLQTIVDRRNLFRFLFEISMPFGQIQFDTARFFSQLFDGQLRLFDHVGVGIRRAFSDHIAQIEIDGRRRRTIRLVFVRAEKNLVFAQRILQLNRFSKLKKSFSRSFGFVTSLTRRFCSFAALE